MAGCGSHSPRGALRLGLDPASGMPLLGLMGTFPAAFPWVLLAAMVAALPLLSVPAVCLTCVYIFPKSSEMHLPKMLVSDHLARRALGVCSPVHAMLLLALLCSPTRVPWFCWSRERELYPWSSTRAKLT